MQSRLPAVKCSSRCFQKRSMSRHHAMLMRPLALIHKTNCHTPNMMVGLSNLLSPAQLRLLPTRAAPPLPSR